VKRLAIVILVVVTLFMGALGWMLGRPGALQPETQVLAAPRDEPPSSSRAGGASSPALLLQTAHGNVRGE
jgi:hypothetical protein